MGQDLWVIYYKKAIPLRWREYDLIVFKFYFFDGQNFIGYISNTVKLVFRQIFIFVKKEEGHSIVAPF